jgi:hypothetical protein
MRAPTRLTVTTVAAIAGLALAGFATVQSARLPGAPTVAADPSASRAEVERLQRQVDLLTRVVGQLRDERATGAAPGASATPSVAALDPASGQPTEAEPTLLPSYRSFDAPAGVTILENGGAFAVRNTDPALTGQVLRVTGERDDGSRDVMVVVVPPPER